MQGKKQLQSKIFTTFSLEAAVPDDDFYKRLDKILDLNFLIPATKKYYGSEGNESIDPRVFFKMVLIGYLENISSDRKLVKHISNSLNLRLFIRYDIDEMVPVHSTVSRTRQLLGEELFEELFEQVVALCIKAGMVNGETQAIDSALVKANASMESLEVKQVPQELKQYIATSKELNDDGVPRHKAKEDKSTPEQRTMQADESKLKELESRYARQKGTGTSSKRDREHARFVSNETHYSPTDPDARVAVKPGKPRALYYSAQVSADTAHHVITHIQAFHAQGRDSDHTKEIVSQTRIRLEKHGLELKRVLGDTHYGSGEIFAWLQFQGIKHWIPIPGGCQNGVEGFTYDEQQDVYMCRQGKILKTGGRKVDDGKGNLVKKYFSKASECAQCIFKQSCIGEKGKLKKVQHTIYRNHIEQAKERMESKVGKFFRQKRSSTIEPVIGSLLEFNNMKKLLTKGLKQANKTMLCAAISYNLKKFMKWTIRKEKQAMALSKTKEAAKTIINVSKNTFHQFLTADYLSLRVLLNPIYRDISVLNMRFVMNFSRLSNLK
jgi:transposase